MNDPREKRPITGWTMTGGHYENGRYFPGGINLFLDNTTASLYYPGSYSLQTAIEDAKRRGHDTAQIEASIDRWIKTGKP